MKNGTINNNWGSGLFKCFSCNACVKPCDAGAERSPSTAAKRLEDGATCPKSTKWPLPPMRRSAKAQNDRLKVASVVGVSRKQVAPESVAKRSLLHTAREQQASGGKPNRSEADSPTSGAATPDSRKNKLAAKPVHVATIPSETGTEWSKERVKEWERSAALGSPKVSFGGLSSNFDGAYGSEAEDDLFGTPSTRSMSISSPSDCEIDARNVSFLPGGILGKGNFSSVYKAYLGDKLVAVKVLRNLANERCDVVTRYIIENVRHPNLLQIYGVQTVKMNSCLDVGSPVPPSSARYQGQDDAYFRRESVGSDAAGQTPRRESNPQTPKTEVSMQSDLFSDLARNLPSKTVAREDYETWIMMEYCDKGHLGDAIRNGVFHESKQTARPVMQNILLAGLQIAAGMMYLHASEIVHGDLKPENVLTTSDREGAQCNLGFTCKIGDFGLSRVLNKMLATHVDTFSCGTITHMAPEVLRDGVISLEGDVYSFGILLWELLTGDKPFHGMPQTNILVSIVEGRRPPLPVCTPNWFAKLIEECWHEDRKARPAFSEIVDRLRLMIVMLEKPHVDPCFATVSSSGCSEKIVAFAGSNFSPFMNGELHHNPFYDAAVDNDDMYLQDSLKMHQMDFSGPFHNSDQEESDDCSEDGPHYDEFVSLSRAGSDAPATDEAFSSTAHLARMQAELAPVAEPAGPAPPQLRTKMHRTPRKSMKVSISCSELRWCDAAQNCWSREFSEGRPSRETVCSTWSPSKSALHHRYSTQALSDSSKSRRSSSSSSTASDHPDLYSTFESNASSASAPRSPQSARSLSPPAGRQGKSANVLRRHVSPWDVLSSGALAFGTVTPLTTRAIRSHSSCDRPRNIGWSPPGIDYGSSQSSGPPGKCLFVETGMSRKAGVASTRIGLETGSSSGWGVPITLSEVDEEAPMQLNELSNCVLPEPIFAMPTRS